MDLFVLALASASVPFGIVAVYDLLSKETEKGLFGVASAAWSSSGVVLVYYGVPGLLFFPGLLVISIAAFLVRARRGGGRSHYAKASALSALLLLITVGLVVL